MLIRCSSLHKIMTMPKNKKDLLSVGAMSYMKEVAKERLFGYSSFEGSRYTEKGKALEDLAIECSGKLKGRKFVKNTRRVNKGFLTGECDILDEPEFPTIDTKCSWSIGTHPFFKDDAEKDCKEAGYDWQMQGYMNLYDRDSAEVHFWLFPCPSDLIKSWEDEFTLTALVEEIPLLKRVTVVKYKRDEAKIALIKEQCEKANEYYQSLIEEYRKG